MKTNYVRNVLIIAVVFSQGVIFAAHRQEARRERVYAMEQKIAREFEEERQRSLQEHIVSLQKRADELRINKGKQKGRLSCNMQ